MRPTPSFSIFTIIGAWQRSLHFRPLLWVASAAVTGAALGFQLAQSRAFDQRPEGYALSLLFFLLFALLALARFWWKSRPFLARSTFALFCAVAMSGHAYQRALPPAGDISFLVSELAASPRSKPLEAPTLTLRGYVDDHPQQGEFAVRFPLEVVEYDEGSRTSIPASGRLWTTAPPDVALEVGDAVQVTGSLRPLARATNPAQREEHWHLVFKHCWALLRVKESEQIRRLPAVPRHRFERHIAGWRRAITAHYERSFQQRGTAYPRANAQLLTAMTFGEGGLETPLPHRVREEFRIAGLSHVLVASGSQVALFGALLLGTSHLLGLRGGWLLALVLPVLLLYAAIAGGEPSILRATIVGVLVTVAVLTGRRTDALSLWSAALVVLAIADPVQLMSLSFQLSFAAVWGLIVIVPFLQRWFSPVLGEHPAVSVVTFSLGAQIGVLPILMYHFGTLSLASIGANLLGVPLAGVLVVTGIAGLLFPLAFINESLTVGIASIASFFAHLPGAQLQTSPLRLLWTAACYASLFLVMFVSATGVSLLEAARLNRSETGKGSSKVLSVLRDVAAELYEDFSGWRRRQQAQLPRWQSVFVFFVLAGTVYTGWNQLQWYQKPLKFVMLDVGQGESLIVISPENRVVLIDGGGDIASQRTNVGQSIITPYLQAYGIRKIDALVITHADADHFNGLEHVLREVPIGMVLAGGADNDPQDVGFQELKNEVLKRDIPWIAARAGQRLNLGSATMEVLAPLSPPLSGSNENSAVLRLDHGEVSILLTGDAEKESEERLVRRGARLESTFLKVGHHGSHSSSTPLFLKAVRPQAALISCGRYNSYRHPATQVLERFEQEQIPVFRTDLDGAIQLFSDGERSWIQTSR